MAAPFSIETGYPAATDVQSAFPAHETAFRQTVNDWLSSFSDPATGLLLPAALDPFLDTTNTWTATQTFADIAIGGDITGSAHFTGAVTMASTLGVTGTSTLGTLNAGAISGASVTTTGSIVSGGTLQANQNVQSGTAALVLGPTGAGTVYLRPNGVGSGAGQAYISANGNMVISGDLTVSGGNITGTATGNAQTTTSIVAGNGLTGGGTLAASRTLSVGASTGITVTADGVAVDTTVWRDGNMPSLAQLNAIGVAGVYTGSNVNNLDFPVGTVIQVSSGGVPARNAAYPIYLSGTQYFSTTASGTALTGTWRARGRGGNEGGSGDTPRLTLFQRTS